MSLTQESENDLKLEAKPTLQYYLEYIIREKKLVVNTFILIDRYFHIDIFIFQQGR